MAQAPSTLHLDGVDIDLETGEVRGRTPHTQLTGMLLKLMRHLAKQPGRTAPREELLREVWGYRADVITRTVDVTTQRLRAKLGPAGKRILTVHGEGYRLEAPDPTQGLKPLLGREAALRQLQTSADRLLVITGPPGVGKSHLARHFMAHQQGDWIALELRQGSAQLAISEALSMDGMTSWARIQDTLKTRGIQWVLADNGEACPDLLLLLQTLKALPELRVVLTTQGPSPEVQAHSMALSGLAPKDSAALYQSLAYGPFPDAQIQALVQAVSHNPLAIEVAAACSAVLGPGSLLEKQRLAEQVHTPLAQILDRALDTLAAADRAALQALACLPSGVSVETAEALLGGEATGALLAGLQAQITMRHDTPFGPRFVFEANLRARLIHGEPRPAIQQWTAARHIASRLRERLYALDHAALGELVLERATLEAGLRAQPGDPVLVLTLAELYRERGQGDALDSLLAQSLGVARGLVLVQRLAAQWFKQSETQTLSDLAEAEALDQDPDLQAMCAMVRARRAAVSGTPEQALDLSRAAMRLAWSAQDKRITRKAVFMHSWICGRAGDREQLQVLDQGIALARRLGAQDTEGRLLLSRAKAQLAYGQTRHARQDLAAAHSLLTSPPAATALTLSSLLAEFREDEEAQRWLTLCIAQARRAGDTLVLASALNNHGMVLAAAGEQARAVEVLQQALQAWMRLESSWHLAVGTLSLGSVSQDPELLSLALERFEALQDKGQLCDALCWNAAMRASQGQPHAARALLAQARPLADTPARQQLLSLAQGHCAKQAGEAPSAPPNTAHLWMDGRVFQAVLRL